MVWSLQPVGPPSRGHAERYAERYAERPDAEEVHPEDDQKMAGSWRGRGRACEVGPRRRQRRPGSSAERGAAVEAAEPPVAHRLANHQGFPNWGSLW